MLTQLSFCCPDFSVTDGPVLVFFYYNRLHEIGVVAVTFDGTFKVCLGSGGVLTKQSKFHCDSH